MSAEVLIWRMPNRPGSELAPPDPRPGLRRLVEGLGLGGVARGGQGWALKVHLGAPGRPAAIAHSWVGEVAATLAGPPGAAPASGTFVMDTLSIATRGLDTAAGLRQIATAKGFGDGTAASAAGLPFLVGDDPEGPPACPVECPPDGDLSGHEVVGTLAQACGLALLAPVRPHPHLGVAGAVAGLGLDLATRQGKLRLHQGIRPQVDTPLCAGCGSCLDVCLYDAIVIRGGRAMIDHRLCTGCGECMGVCFMAGIAPEEAAGLELFQSVVAQAARSTATHCRLSFTQPILYMNFLVQLDSRSTAAKARRRAPLTGIGVLASLDAVAVDAATLDLLGERLGGDLSQWSGYSHAPGPMLAKAEALGLGTRTYRLREV